MATMAATNTVPALSTTLAASSTSCLYAAIATAVRERQKRDDENLLHPFFHRLCCAHWFEHPGCWQYPRCHSRRARRLCRLPNVRSRLYLPLPDLARLQRVKGLGFAPPRAA